MSGWVILMWDGRRRRRGGDVVGDGAGTWRAAIGWTHGVKRLGDVDRSAGPPESSQWEGGVRTGLTTRRGTAWMEGKDGSGFDLHGKKQLHLS